MSRMKKITFKIDDELLRQIDEYMEIMYGDNDKEKNRSVVIRKAIRQFLEEERKRMMKINKRIRILNI